MKSPSAQRPWQNSCGTAEIPWDWPRQLEKLEQAGQIHKIRTEEGAFYQICPHRAAQGRECFLLRCERCGHVVHLDCGHLHALYEHLEAEHHFRIDPRRTILTGLCQACAGKEDPHGTQ